MKADPRRLYFRALAPLLIFRLWLATALPVTGDEAYFIEWGRIPDWGYYDHPPMIGWWLAAQLWLGDAAWWLRLASVLQPFLISAAVAWCVPRIWPDASEPRRWWAALLVLLAPTSVWNVLITTDTPLIYFSVFSGLAWLRARRDDHSRWYLLCGLLLAGAVLSKYFVAFLGLAYLLDVALQPRRRGWAGLALVFACCLPALALMAWWNMGHCWPNYMFNFVNRQSNAALSWKTPLLYALTLLYVLTPPVAWQLARGLRRERSLAWLVFVPLGLFAALSLIKTIGLHWVLSFLPFAFLGVALTASQATLIRSGRFVMAFAVLHVVIIVLLSFTALKTWQGSKWYDSTVLAFRSKEIAARLEPYAADYALASDGYADAATLGYAARRRFHVFGEASSHARHDDILTDWRRLEGGNLLILKKSRPQPGEYQAYFREIKVQTFELDGVTFYQVFGKGFDYVRYRDTVLAAVKRKYYVLPAWLPQRGCYFCDRYFTGQTCLR